MLQVECNHEMAIEKPFKNYVRELFEKHINENLEAYVEGTLSVAKRRILTTNWNWVMRITQMPSAQKEFTLLVDDEVWK